VHLLLAIRLLNAEKNASFFVIFSIGVFDSVINKTYDHSSVFLSFSFNSNQLT
jgi:hypothetical protein